MTKYNVIRASGKIFIVTRHDDPDLYTCTCPKWRLGHQICEDILRVKLWISEGRELDLVDPRIKEIDSSEPVRKRRIRNP